MENAKDIHTDEQFEQFLIEHLKIDAWDQMVKDCQSLIKSGHFYNLPTILMKIVMMKPRNNILALTKQFLENLPFEEAVAYVTTTNSGKNSVIFMCENIAYLKIFIKYVPDINVKNDYQNNALAWSCISDTYKSINPKKIKFLLEQGIDINATNQYDQTALMYCCYGIKHSTPKNIEKVLELLIFSGADPFIKSNDNKTAYDYVIDKSLLTERSVQLLQGVIKMNRTKKAQKN